MICCGLLSSICQAFRDFQESWFFIRASKRLGRLLRAYPHVGRPELNNSYFNQSQVFINISPDWQIVDAQVSNNLLIVNNEGASEADAGIVEDTIGISDLLVHIGQERDVYFSQTSLGSRLFGIFHVGKVGVDGAANDVAADFAEMLGFVGEVDDLGGTDECEVEGIEKQEKPFSFEIVEGHFFESLGLEVEGSSLEEGSSFPDGGPNCSCSHGYDQIIQSSESVLYLYYYMSQKSASQSSSGSATSLKRCVEQILIESDEQEKNTRNLGRLRGQFPVLGKINNSMTNNEKLQVFIKDNHFKQRVQEKMLQNKVNLGEGIPILKAYIVSTRYNADVQEEFDESDLVYVFQKFGPIHEIYVCDKYAYVQFYQINSLYISMKVLDQFHVSDRVRLRVRLASQQEALQAHSLFFQRARGSHQAYEPGCASIGRYGNNNGMGVLKHIAKFQFGVLSLPEFNIAQRIIGPKGSYLKRIIEKILSKHPLAHKYTLSNIDSVFKMRIRGKGSGFLEAGQESQQKMHLFVSSKEKWMYEAACLQVQILLNKVLQDYKVSFQKLYRIHATGIAYLILQYENNYYVQIRRVFLEEIEETVDLISLEKQGQLSERTILEKIQQREQARKNGKFDEADNIRNWLKSRGVALVDSKIKRGKTTWNYIKL